MRILFVINSLGAAGAERLTVDLVNNLAKTHDVSLYTFVSDKDFFDEKVSDKVSFYQGRGEQFLTLSKLKLLKNLIEKQDVVHVHLFPSMYIVPILTLLNSKVKLFYTEHGTNNNRRKKLFWLIENFVYRKYNRLLCISNGVEASLKNWQRNIPTTVIHNAIDINEINKAIPISREELGFSNRDKIVIMVGRFDKFKDHVTLIKTLHFLPNNFKLCLIGVGDTLENVLDLIKSLDLIDRVKYLGLRNDVFSIMKACDYGILSSHYEGFGLVAIEYMACGLISLGSNISGLKEVIDNPYLLFESGDFKSLAHKILELDKSDEFSERIVREQNIHVRKFDLSRFVERHEEIYLNSLK